MLQQVLPCCVIIIASLSLFTSSLLLAWDFVQNMTCTLGCTTFVIIWKYMCGLSVQIKMHRCEQMESDVSQFHLKDFTIKLPSSYWHEKNTKNNICSICKLECPKVLHGKWLWTSNTLITEWSTYSVCKHSPIHYKNSLITFLFVLTFAF